MTTLAVILFTYFLAINAVTYVAFRHDKKASATTGARRIPEATLLNLALIGGSIGAKRAQRKLRHKTRKQPFATLLNAICVLHCAALLAGLLWISGGWPTILNWVGY